MSAAVGGERSSSGSHPTGGRPVSWLVNLVVEYYRETIKTHPDCQTCQTWSSCDVLRGFLAVENVSAEYGAVNLRLRWRSYKQRNDPEADQGQPRNGNQLIPDPLQRLRRV